MPVILRKDIAPEIRGKHDAAHRAQLWAALGNPGLTEQQRAHIRKQLDNLGKPKLYSADTPPKPGAIAFSDMPDPFAGLTKKELVARAKDRGLPYQGTKAQIIDRLREMEQGETP